MKRIFTLAILFFTLSCNNSDKETGKESVTDIDAARNFLNASLKGDFKEASNYMLQDSTNTGFLFYTEEKYKTQSPEDKRQLREASIHFYNHPNQKPNDSTTIIVYSNSYRNDKDTLKIVRQQGKWLVDLKYLFTHDSDTLFNKIDTIQH